MPHGLDISTHYRTVCKIEAIAHMKFDQTGGAAHAVQQGAIVKPRVVNERKVQCITQKILQGILSLLAISDVVAANQAKLDQILH